MKPTIFQRFLSCIERKLFKYPKKSCHASTIDKAKANQAVARAARKLVDRTIQDIATLDGEMGWFYDDPIKEVKNEHRQIHI